jgi:putative ABC transport system ATP-binding protein
MIELKNISKIYETSEHKRVVALKEVSMSFKEGELILLKGPSGSGKSSILSLIAGLSKPTSGEVIVDSKRISKLSDTFAALYRRDNIGFIFQKYNLIPNISVADNILLPLIPLNLCADDAQKKVSQVMEKFHISHKKETIVKNLSGGEQQRVAIARANVNEPKIILADEPTANLDKELSLKFIEILRELKSQNKTIIVATHDPLFFGLDFVDREIEMANGELHL